MDKRIYPPKVGVYFGGTQERKFLEKFIMTAQRLGISESQLAYRAMRKGFKKAVQEIETLDLKLDEIDK